MKDALAILERLGVTVDQFCRLAAVERDDFFASVEDAATPNVRAAAILKLLRYCGKTKLLPILAIIDEKELEREWRKIPRFSAYEVSSDGRVRRATISAKGAVRTMRAIPTRSGHLKVTLYRSGKPEPQRIHRLVCEAFHGPPPPDRPYACHINGDPSDNGADNLYWGSPADNSADLQRHIREGIVQRPYTLMSKAALRHLARTGKRNRHKALDMLSKKRRKK